MNFMNNFGLITARDPKNNYHPMTDVIIEVHIGTLLADQAFTFTDWTAEMKAKASICITEDSVLIESLEIAKQRIQIMIEKGMDNKNETLQKLANLASNRIEEIKSGARPALVPDNNAKYFSKR